MLESCSVPLENDLSSSPSLLSTAAVVVVVVLGVVVVVVMVVEEHEEDSPALMVPAAVATVAMVLVDMMGACVEVRIPGLLTGDSAPLICSKLSPRSKGTPRITSSRFFCSS